MKAGAQHVEPLRFKVFFREKLISGKNGEGMIFMISYDELREHLPTSNLDFNETK